MRVEPLGDSAYLLRDLPAPAHLVANALNARPPEGLIEVVAAYETVGLYVDPARFDLESLAIDPAEAPEPLRHVIPVCYELGPDLETSAHRLGMTPEALIGHHSSCDYQCFAIGFCPGFPYLGYLPDEIAGLPRHAQPRPRVPARSVGITGRQTGVYPLDRPGGWPLIGMTPLTLVDVEADFFPISAGDWVRFEPITRREYAILEGRRL